MTVLSCAAVRPRLESFHDRELPVRELIAIEAHLKECAPCLRDLHDLQSLGEALRLATAPGDADDWNGLTSGVISRMRAEENESLSARVSRVFEDMHLVWIALASTAATFLCGAIVLGMLHFGSPERDDSLAALIAVLGAPSGSDLNPAWLDARIQFPSLPQDGVMPAMLAETVSDEELVLALSAVVTREGRVAGVSVLSSDHNRRQVDDILNAISHGRLEPAQYAGSPVAVNLVWLLAHTTVRGKLSS